MTIHTESRPARVARFQRHVAGLTLAIEALERCLADVDLDFDEEWHDDAEDALCAANDARNSILAAIERLQP